MDKHKSGSKIGVLCYQCAAEACSREHAPPLCFFPDQVNIGSNLRKNLITVPSCDEHNSKKSTDDEYLRWVILSSTAHASRIADHQFMGKMIRGAKRNVGAYSNYYTEHGQIDSGEKTVLQIDRNRFDKCIDHLSRALFFYEFQKQWLLPILVLSPNFYSSLKNNEVEEHGSTNEGVSVIREFLWREPSLGENPEVFKYRMRFDAKANVFALAAIFYDFFEIYAVSSPALVTDVAM